MWSNQATLFLKLTLFPSPISKIRTNNFWMEHSRDLINFPKFDPNLILKIVVYNQSTLFLELTLFPSPISNLIRTNNLWMEHSRNLINFPKWHNFLWLLRKSFFVGLVRSCSDLFRLVSTDPLTHKCRFSKANKKHLLLSKVSCKRKLECLFPLW